MKRIEKIVQAFLRRRPEADYSDVEFLLLEFGFIRNRQSASHVIFKNRPGLQPPHISVPLVSGRKVKRHYIRMLVILLDLETWNEKNK